MDEQLKKHGAVSWFELTTKDVPGAKAFYGKLFGWTLEDMSMVPGMNYTMVKANGKDIAGIMATPPQAQGMPPSWGTYVTVDDVDAIAKSVAALGGKVLVAPQDIPNVGRFCWIQDPQGAAIGAITYKS